MYHIEDREAEVIGKCVYSLIDLMFQKDILMEFYIR
jgi:hypothetical protein